MNNPFKLQQKRYLAVILGTDYISYPNALVLTILPRLDTFRKDVRLKWAIKAKNDPRHSDLFPLTNSEKTTRNKTKFVNQFCRGVKLYKSTITYMRTEQILKTEGPFFNIDFKIWMYFQVILY